MLNSLMLAPAQKALGSLLSNTITLTVGFDSSSDRALMMFDFISESRALRSLGLFRKMMPREEA